jgi:polyisoprenoid-binding protein YceI
MRNSFYALSLLALCVLTGAASAAMLEVNHQESKITVAVVTSVHDFVGELGVYDASIHFDPGATLPDKASVSFDFKGLKTGSKGRDEDMLKWLKYAANPKATFHLTGWKQDGTNSVALGELTMHGVKQTIQMPAIVKQDANVCEITGTANLNYRDFELPVIRKVLLFSVDPHLTVKFHLNGRLSPAK